MIVQLRPPKIGTRNEYGMRSVAPTRLGIEMSQKIWLLSSVKPASGIRTTTMLHSCQITNPRNSAKIDQTRFRLAIARPGPSHCARFSGSHPSIQRPRRWTRPVSSGAAVVPTAASGVVPAGGAVSVASVIVISWGVASEVELVIPKLRTVRFAVSCAV